MRPVCAAAVVYQHGILLRRLLNTYLFRMPRLWTSFVPPLLCSPAALQLLTAVHFLPDASSRQSGNLNITSYNLFCLCLLCFAVLSKTCSCCCCCILLLGWLGSAQLRPVYSSYDFTMCRQSSYVPWYVKYERVGFSMFLLCLLCCCRSIKI